MNDAVVWKFAPFDELSPRGIHGCRDVAASRESRRSDANRLIAGSLALLAFDAHAHSFGIEAWGIPVLVGLCGVTACFLVYLIHGRQGLALRLAIGAGLSLLDIAIWWALGSVSMAAASYAGYHGPPWMADMWYATLGIWPWMLPVYVGFKLRGRRKQ